MRTASLTEGVARSRVIKAIRLVPGRHGVIDIEVDVYENHEAGRARSELKGMLPDGVCLIGGPTWGAGSAMGTVLGERSERASLEFGLCSRS